MCADYLNLYYGTGYHNVTKSEYIIDMKQDMTNKFDYYWIKIKSDNRMVVN